MKRIKSALSIGSKNQIFLEGSESHILGIVKTNESRCRLTSNEARVGAFYEWYFQTRIS